MSNAVEVSELSLSMLIDELSLARCPPPTVVGRSIACKQSLLIILLSLLVSCVNNGRYIIRNNTTKHKGIMRCCCHCIVLVNDDDDDDRANLSQCSRGGDFSFLFSRSLQSSPAQTDLNHG
jgi:hypothetical protein